MFLVVLPLPNSQHEPVEAFTAFHHSTICWFNQSANAVNRKWFAVLDFWARSPHLQHRKWYQSPPAYMESYRWRLILTFISFSLVRSRVAICFCTNTRVQIRAPVFLLVPHNLLHKHRILISAYKQSILKLYIYDRSLFGLPCRSHP